MKAKVIATGEIVDVSYSHTTDDGIGIYKDNQGRCWSFYELECKETYIDWEQRRYDLVKAAMQGICANAEQLRLIDKAFTISKITTKGSNILGKVYAELAFEVADAVLAKLKEK